MVLSGMRGLKHKESSVGYTPKSTKQKRDWNEAHYEAGWLIRAALGRWVRRGGLDHNP
jgi:hypothetical protein